MLKFENIATSNSTPRSRPNTKPWLDTSNVIDSAPASTASLIFLVKETVSGVVFAPFVFVSLIWKPLVPKYALFFVTFFELNESSSQ